MKIIIICEGQTEADFVNKILSGRLYSFGYKEVRPITVKTGKNKSGGSAKGGDFSWERLKKEIGRQIQNAEKLVTTFCDYYALKDDFPGYDAAKKMQNPYSAVSHLETMLEQEILSANFIPYIQLHETETLLFSDLPTFRANIPEKVDFTPLEKALADNQGKPELINTRQETSPSHRIIDCFEKSGVAFAKTVTGVAAMEKIGLEKMCEKCPHFNGWVEKLENFVNLQ